LDILNLPNPVYNLIERTVKAPLNVMNFYFDKAEDILNPHDFPYYKY